MKISVVIPAYNEEKLLGACLESVRAAFGSLAAPAPESEVIVCDNNSTDSTPRIAASFGAKVVFEPVNQIGRARNAGAAAASGDWLLFIDADSRLDAGNLRQLLAAAGGGKCCGGGAAVRFDHIPNRWGWILVAFWNFLSRMFRWAAGSFIFCRADVFRKTGGFSGDLYAAEEIVLSRNIRRWGLEKGLDFVILAGSHISSGRKFCLYTVKEHMAVIMKLLFTPRRALRDPDVLKHLYDGRR